MEKINFPKKFKVYLPLIMIFVILVFLMPRSSRFAYDYEKGTTWKYETLIAQFDFPVLKTEEQYQRELENAVSRVIPYYRYDAKVSSRSADELAVMEFGDMDDVRLAASDALDDIYAVGVLSPSAALEPDAVVYVQKDRRAVKVPASEVYTLSHAYEILKEKLQKWLFLSIAKLFHRKKIKIAHKKQNSLKSRNIKAKSAEGRFLPPKGRSNVIKSLIYHIAKLPRLVNFVKYL